DLAMLKEVAQLTSWRPHYYLHKPTPDRLAEVVLKLERELYRIHRPKQLAARDVLVKISTPIDMGQHVQEYVEDPKSVRRKVTEQLHQHTQSLVDTLAERTIKI